MVIIHHHGLAHFPPETTTSKPQQEGKEGRRKERKDETTTTAPAAPAVTTKPIMSDMRIKWEAAPEKTKAAKEKEQHQHTLVHETDFLSIGTHCAIKDCNQLDFLPATCHQCGITTCQSHLHNHNCSNPPQNVRF